MPESAGIRQLCGTAAAMSSERPRDDGPEQPIAYMVVSTYQDGDNVLEGVFRTREAAEGGAVSVRALRADQTEMPTLRIVAQEAVASLKCPAAAERVDFWERRYAEQCATIHRLEAKLARLDDLRLSLHAAEEEAEIQGERAWSAEQELDHLRKVAQALVTRIDAGIVRVDPAVDALRAALSPDVRPSA